MRTGHQVLRPDSFGGDKNTDILHSSTKTVLQNKSLSDGGNKTLRLCCRFIVSVYIRLILQVSASCASLHVNDKSVLGKENIRG